MYLKDFKKGIENMYNKKDLLKWYDNDYCLEAVKQNGYALQFIENPTKKMCLTAITQDLHIIQFINIKKFPEVWDKYMLENLY